jgi:rod shape-determining protein MreC
VKLERRSLSRLAVPLKALADRFAFGALLILSLALLIVGKANVALLERVGSTVGDALVPALEVLMQPIGASRRLVEGIGELVALRDENARLREQNARLLEWQSAARQLTLENAALRQLLNMRPDPERPTAVAGRVVADAGGPFVHTVLVDVGAEDGVADGMAAVNERGLIGRVIDVGRHSARVLLLTDFNSRIPVMVEPSRDRAILAGDNTRAPGLIFLPLNPRLAIGDRVVTSGHGGMLPAGLPIGVVSAIDDDKVAVAPFVDWDRLEYVRLLQYAPVRAPEALADPQAESDAAPATAEAPSGEPPAAERSEAPESSVPAAARSQDGSP